MYYASKHLNEDILLLIAFPVSIFTMYKMQRAFFSEKFQNDTKNHQISFIILVLLVCLFLIWFMCLVIRHFMKFYAKYHFGKQGVFVKLLFRKEKLIPWEKIQDVCVCSMFRSRFPPIGIIRFSTGNEQKAKKKLLFRSWEQWLDYDYIDLHFKKIYFISYSKDAEDEIRKHYPNIWTDESFWRQSSK